MKPSNLSRTLKSLVKQNLPVLIVGAPGVGKSDIVSQVCKELGHDLILSHPVVSDPTDYKGMPWAYVDDNNVARADFIPFGDLELLINADKPTVFFLDDLGQAPASVQAAAMQLLLARRINEHKVSDYVTFIAATNRREDKAGVQGILEPVKSRFATIVTIDADLDDWCKWAAKNNVSPELIGFLRFKPNMLHDFKASKDMVNSPCPRTVANVGKILTTDLPDDLLFEVIRGAAGEGFAVEFMAFLKIFSKLPNPDAILMNPSTAQLPDASEPSIMFALSVALSARATETNMDAYTTVIGRMPIEYAFCSMTDATMRNPQLANTKAFGSWATKNSSFIV